MVHLRKIQSQLFLGTIALGSSVAIALPQPSFAIALEEPSVYIQVDEVVDGYNPPNFIIRDNHLPEGVGPVPLQWLEEMPQQWEPIHTDYPSESKLHPIAPTTPDTPQKQEVPDQD